MLYKKRANVKRVRRPRRRVSRPRRSGVSSAVKKFVKKTIHSQIENKCSNVYGNELPVRNGGVYGTYTTLNLVPTFTQGTGQQQRIGNTIKPVKWTLDLHFRPNFLSVTTNPYPHCGYRVIVFSIKNDRSLITAPTTLPLLFQTGSSAVGLQGTTLDLLFKTNKDVYNIYMDKQFNMSSTSEIGGLINDWVVPSGFPPAKKMSINLLKYCSKSFKFNDGASDRPMNASMFLLVTGVSMNSSLACYTPAQFSYVNNFEFEDA